MEKTISALIEGGKASAGPPLGSTLGPMGVDINKVIAEINEKTKEFVGVTVPVKVIVDTDTKDFKIEIGTPPVSSLLKQEIAVDKGSPKAKEEKIGDITIDQIIKIARIKKDTVHARKMRGAVKEIIGSCIPMGVLVDGKDPRDAQKDVDAGKYDDKIEGKTPLKLPTKEEIEKKKQTFMKAIEEKHAEEEAAKAEEEAKKAEAAEAEKPEEAKEGEEKPAEEAKEETEGKEGKKEKSKEEAREKKK